MSPTMRKVFIVRVLVVLAVGLGVLLWFFLRPTDVGSDVESMGSSAVTAAASVSAPSATPIGSAQVVPSSKAPLKRSHTKQDRAQRDELRKRIYAAFGQAPPDPKRPRPSKAAAPSTQAPRPKGSLDKDYIQQRIREDFIPLAKECYEAALERDPDLGGKLSVDFEIVGDESVGGIVESAELSEDSEIQDREFMYCMRESMLSMSFEPPKGGGSVKVTYPFVFSSNADETEAPAR